MANQKIPLKIFTTKRQCSLTFIITISIYLFTLAPTVTGEDSGELISAAYGWGVAHPPGYPLWTILAGTFSKLFPFGNIAFRINLLSAILAAIAASIITKILNKHFSINALSSILGGICFACGLHLWSQAVITEVYTLQILLTCLNLYCLFEWNTTLNPRCLYAISLLTGLGFSNHSVTILLVLCLLFFVLIRKPRTFISMKVVLVCLSLFFVGLLPYLYLPIAASHDPYVNWGNITDWNTFLDHILRRQYSDDSMHESHSIGRLLFHLKTLWSWNKDQYTVYAIPFIITGIWVMLLRKHYRLLIFTLVYFLIHTIFFAELLNFKNDRQELFCARVFFLPAYIILAIWLVIGCSETFTAICQRLFNRPSPWISSIPLMILTGVVICFNFPQNNMHRYYYADDHATNLLNSLEKNALIIPSGDHNTFPLIYKHYVEKIRPDITIADKYGYIEYNLYKDMPNAPKTIKTHQQRMDIEAYLIEHSNRPVYYTVQPDLRNLPNYEILSHGMLFRVYHKDQKPENLPLPHYTYRNLEKDKSIIDQSASVILSDYYFHLASNALRNNDKEQALAYVEKTAILSNGLKEQMNNLGTLMAEFALNDQAIKYYEKAASLDEQYLTPRWNLARLFQSKGDLLHAIQVFNDLAQLESDDFRVYGELGFLLYRYGETEMAIENWGKSLSLNPNQFQIIEALSHLYNTPSPSVPINNPLTENIPLSPIPDENPKDDL